MEIIGSYFGRASVIWQDLHIRKCPFSFLQDYAVIFQQGF